MTRPQAIPARAHSSHTASPSTHAHHPNHACAAGRAVSSFLPSGRATTSHTSELPHPTDLPASLPAAKPRHREVQPGSRSPRHKMSSHRGRQAIRYIQAQWPRHKGRAPGSSGGASLSVSAWCVLPAARAACAPRRCTALHRAPPPRRRDGARGGGARVPPRQEACPSTSAAAASSKNLHQGGHKTHAEGSCLTALHGVEGRHRGDGQGDGAQDGAAGHQGVEEVPAGSGGLPGGVGRA